jgi:hypothetical protein
MAQAAVPCVGFGDLVLNGAGGQTTKQACNCFPPLVFRRPAREVEGLHKKTT